MKYYFLLISLFTIPTFCFGQFTAVKDESVFKTKTEQINATTNTMASEFVQEKHLSFMSEPIFTEGRFRYKKPNMIRWEYTQPFSYILIINNDQLYIDDEGNQNEIDLGNNDMFKQINKIISNALMGKVLESEGQFSYVLEESSSSYRIILTPIEKALEQYLQTIEVFFDKDNMIVSKVIMRESEEDFTVIKFNNNKLNTNLKDAEFELKG